jgi:histidinol-phosphate aminotransferase
LGWAYCPAHVADVLNRIRGPFNVSAAAMAAGVAAIGDQKFIETAIAHNEKWLALLTEQLQALGLKVTPSVGNFLLIHFASDGKKTAPMADAYLNEHGIILRRMEAYDLPHCLRMTIGDEEANRNVVSVLADFLT